MNALLLLAGRISLALIFLFSGMNKVSNFGAVAEKMAGLGVPATSMTLPLAILFLLLGSLSLLAGFRVKLGAGLLAVFIILATIYFHNFWAFEESARQMQQIQFMKNLSILGGLLAIAAAGPGAISVDGMLGRTGAPVVSNYDVIQATGRKD